MVHVVRIDDRVGDLFASPLAGVCSWGNMPAHLHSAAVTADWSQSSFVSISQIAAVAQVQLDSLERCGIPASISAPSGNVDSYISRMNYYSIVGTPRGESFTRHSPHGRFMPMERICPDRNSNDIPGMLSSVVLDHISTSDTVKDAVSFAFGEVVDNVIQHSESSCGGLACAQFYPKAASVPYVEYCVTDSGRGIAASMSDNEQYIGINPAMLVAKAFERGTGQWYGRVPDGSSKVSGGVGLSISERLAKALGGIVWCVSHGNAVEIRDGVTKTIDGLYFPGTIVTVRLPVPCDAVINESDLFDGGEDRPMRWSPQEGRYYEDEDDWELW